MSIFGSWRYYWLYDELERNPQDLVNCYQCMNSFIKFLNEKPFNQKLGKASDVSVEQLCKFIDLYKKFNKEEDL